MAADFRRLEGAICFAGMCVEVQSFAGGTLLSFACPAQRFGNRSLTARVSCRHLAEFSGRSGGLRGRSAEALGIVYLLSCAWRAHEVGSEIPDRGLVRSAGTG